MRAAKKQQANTNEETEAASLWQADKPRGGRFMALVFGLIALIVSYVLVTSSLIPERVDLKAGDIAPQTLYASRDVADKVTTEAHRQEAIQAVKNVERLNESLSLEQQRLAQDYFSALFTVRNEAEKIRAQRMQLATSRDEYYRLPKDTPLSQEQWRLLLRQEDFTYLRAMLTLPFADIEIEQLLALEADELGRVQDIVLAKLATALKSGITQYQLVPLQKEMQNELRSMQFSEAVERMGDKAINAFLAVTLDVDERATELRREQAAQDVTPVIVRRGEMIIAYGEQVSNQTIGILEELGLIRPPETDMRLYVGAGVMLVFVFVLFAAYLLIFRGSLLLRSAQVLVMGLVILISIVLMYPTIRYNAWINPAALGVLLVALLVGPKPAMAANFLLAFIGGLIAGGWSDLLGSATLISFGTYVVGGTVAVMVVRKAQHRGKIMLGGLVGGIAAMAFLAGARYLIGASVSELLASCGWVLGTYMLSAVICIGTLPFWETVFDVATPTRLMELCEANRPMLRKLMTEAPGTYHHSLMVASLSENAAEAIGKNALLARAGAYYHDIGKLRRPLYFVENQRGGANPHDQLPPEQSAKILFYHVKDGLTFAHKIKLPTQVRRIVAEHHGDTAAMYFYHKAAASGEQANLQSYRYPGPRPSSAESAIVMMADSVEAGVRSLAEQTRETIWDMIQKIVKGKIEDGQFSEAPLTLAEIKRMELAFLKTYSGLLHERIAYPTAANDKEAEDDRH